MAANLADTLSTSITVMPVGASGRLAPSGTRHKPAWLAAKASRRMEAPEKNVTCRGPAPARSARSCSIRPASAPPGTAMPAFSQICAREKGPRFSKNRGSAIGLLLARRRRPGVEVDLDAGQLLVETLDGVAGDVKAGGR